MLVVSAACTSPFHSLLKSVQSYASELFFLKGNKEFISSTGF